MTFFRDLQNSLEVSYIISWMNSYSHQILKASHNHYIENFFYISFALKRNFGQHVNVPPTNISWTELTKNWSFASQLKIIVPLFSLFTNRNSSSLVVLVSIYVSAWWTPSRLFGNAGYCFLRSLYNDCGMLLISRKRKNKLEAQVSLYRSPDINKSSYECLHAEYI
jgi:hypothetical protein